MERARHVEWEITAGHLGQNPLGFRVSLAEDRFLTRIASTASSFDGTGAFQYDPGKTGAHFVDFPTAGLASPSPSLVGTPVRFRLQSSACQRMPVVWNAEVLHRVAPDGRQVLERLPLPDVTPRFLAHDSRQNDVYLTGDQGTTYVVPVPLARPCASFFGGTDLQAALPDGRRHRIWFVRKEQSELQTLAGAAMVTVANPYRIDAVQAAHVAEASGELFLLALSSETGSGGFFWHYRPADAFSYSADLLAQDIGPWGAHEALLADETAFLKRYSGGSITTFADLADHVDAIGSVTSHKGPSLSGGYYVYVWDRANSSIHKVHWEQAGEVWHLPLPSGDYPVAWHQARLRTSYESAERGRQIVFWSPYYAGSVIDLGVEARLGGFIELEPTTALQPSGTYLSGHKARPVWVRIESVSAAEEPLLDLPSSSSSVSSSSTISASSESSSTFASKSSSSSTWLSESSSLTSESSSSQLSGCDSNYTCFQVSPYSPSTPICGLAGPPVGYPDWNGQLFYVSGCRWGVSGGPYRIGGGNELDAVNTYVELVGNTWTFYYYGIDGANGSNPGGSVLQWQGTKTGDTTPQGTYNRTGGCLVGLAQLSMNSC